jgi:phospholipid/cholesterol/gamma-HCH transport system ATP-binding protein
VSGAAAAPVLQMTGVSKTFQALRPLRVASLTVEAGERVAISGIDAGAGELLVNLVTGASLPDAGEVRVFGRPTADIANGDEWLESLDRFGIVSPRGVLLEGSTLEQNLAMPFTLAIDPIPPDIRERVRDVARRCGIDPVRWSEVRAGDLPADMRLRAHLARALALEPQLLVIEHPTADLEAAAGPPLAADVVKACAAGRITLLVLTNDDAFGRAVAARHLKLHGATGELRPVKRSWFG